MDNLEQFVIDESTFQRLSEIAKLPEDAHILANATHMDPKSFMQFLQHMGIEKNDESSKLLNEAIAIENSHLIKEQSHSVYVIDDNRDVLDSMIGNLESVGFVVTGFNNGEDLLSCLESTNFEVHNLPDLFIIDLELGEKRINGIDLIEELAKKDVPSEIIAISGYYSSADIIDNLTCFEYATIISKPFNFDKMFDVANRMAKVGRKRRLRHLKADKTQIPLIDPEREHRTVFMSYAEEDRSLAKGVKRQLELKDIRVWYTPTNKDKGKKWRKHLENNIDSSAIFLPLLTDSYVDSSICMGELNRYRHRMEKDFDRKLLLLPILGNLSEKSRSEFNDISNMRQTTQCIEFHPHRVDGLTVLLSTVQQALQNTKEGAYLR